MGYTFCKDNPVGGTVAAECYGDSGGGVNVPYELGQTGEEVVQENNSPTCHKAASSPFKVL